MITCAYLSNYKGIMLIEYRKYSIVCCLLDMLAATGLKVP